MKDKTTKDKTFPEGVDCTGFIIHQPGDHSVGLWDASWELKGDFMFQDLNDFKLFTEAIATAFEYVCGDRPGVYSFEDMKEEARIEAELLKAEKEIPPFDDCTSPPKHVHLPINDIVLAGIVHEPDCTSPPKQTTLPNSGVVIAGHVHPQWDGECSPALDQLEQKINDIGASPDQFCGAAQYAKHKRCQQQCWYCQALQDISEK